MSYIEQSRTMFDQHVNLKYAGSNLNTLLETKHQKKILDFLEDHGFEAIKISVANKAGNSDIVACSPIGQFWKIEVKREKGVLKPLQYVKLLKFWEKKAVCLVAYGFEDFKYKYDMLTLAA